jgi:hypothetical protein
MRRAIQKNSECQRAPVMLVEEVKTAKKNRTNERFSQLDMG